MKSFSSLLKTGLRLLVFPLGLVLCQTLPAAVSFTVTPSAVSNTYNGNITLLVTGLTNGETVVIQKFVDANTNSVIDAADVLVQQFRLKDGQASLFGAVTNINVPGDTDSTTGRITAQLIFQTGDFVQKIVGKYAFKLSSPSGNFAPLTNSFSLIDFPYSQSITGSVVNGGTNVPNASIILFPPPRPGHGPGTPLGGAVANNSGNYSIRVSPGVYMLLAFKSNYLANAATAPVVTVNSGATVATNIVLTNATQSISGRIVDAATNSIGLPGLGLHGSASGLIAFGFSDTNGNFTLRVGPGQWGLGAEGLAAQGYLGFDSDNFSVNTSTGSVSGVIVAYPKVTALFYGSVKDDQNRPLAGVDIFSQDNNNQYNQDVLTDTNGNYVAGALGGQTWSVEVDDKQPAFTNYIFSRSASQQNGGTNLSAGTVVLQNFTAILATNHITGHLQDNNGTPITNVQVYAYANVNGKDYQTQVDTDASGNYSLNVPNGNWSVGVCCGCDDCDNCLSSAYCCVNNQNANIFNGDGIVNFTAVLAGQVAITTTSPLPNGTVGNFYQLQFAGSGCQTPFNWSLSPSSPPPPAGLSLFSNGTLSGVPGTAGSNYFSVRVTDTGNHTSDKAFSLTINPSSSPLQVTTTALPDGTLNTFYSQPVNASGGQQPYSWSLAPGSAPLPPGLNLSNGLSVGTISGTPTNSGTFFFNVRVTDGLSATADGLLSIYIPTPPLQITTLSLPNAQQGASYTNQLQASGGQMPYSWSLAPGSLSLPPNLSLSTGGVISGTAATDGTFFFIVRVTDGSFAFTNRSLSLTINPKPTLTALNRTGNQFQLRLTGTTGQNYTVQFSTNLANPNWFSLLMTNPSAASVTILDPDATNFSRFYRALVGP